MQSLKIGLSSDAYLANFKPTSEDAKLLYTCYMYVHKKLIYRIDTE